jgi:hypothetical protein
VKQLRSLAIPLLMLTLALGCGKKTPDGTTPPDSSGGASGGAVEGGGDGGGDGGGSEGGGSESGGSESGGGSGSAPSSDLPEGCTGASEVSGTPTALFADKMILRLPKNVSLTEKTPFLYYAKDQGSTCDADVGMFVGYFEYDAARPTKGVRDDTLGQFGFPANELTWSDETEKGPNYMGTFDIGAGPKGEPPVKGLVTFKEAEGILYFAVYTAHPNAWKAVKATFEESAKRIVILRAKK